MRRALYSAPERRAPGRMEQGRTDQGRMDRDWTYFVFIGVGSLALGLVARARRWRRGGLIANLTIVVAILAIMAVLYFVGTEL